MGEMRNRLNVEEILQIKKKAKRNAIKWALVIGFILEFIVLSGTYMGSNNSDTKVDSIAMMQLVIICFGFLLFYLKYKLILDQEKGKLSAALAEGCLSTETWTEVIPIKANEYQEFVLKELPTKAKFFAKLREDGDIIDVSVQFHHEKEYLPLEEIGKRYFLDYYSILEESEKEPEEKNND